MDLNVLKYGKKKKNHLLEKGRKSSLGIKTGTRKGREAWGRLDCFKQ